MKKSYSIKAEYIATCVPQNLILSVLPNEALLKCKLRGQLPIEAVEELFDSLAECEGPPLVINNWSIRDALRACCIGIDFTPRSPLKIDLGLGSEYIYVYVLLSWRLADET